MFTKPTTEPYPEPVHSSLHLYILFPEDAFDIHQNSSGQFLN